MLSVNTIEATRKHPHPRAGPRTRAKVQRARPQPPPAAPWMSRLRTPQAAGESGNRSDDRAERTKRYVRRGRSEDAARSPACGAVEPVAADAAGGRRGRQRSRARAEAYSDVRRSEREASTPAAAPHAAQWNPWLRTPQAVGEGGSAAERE